METAFNDKEKRTGLFPNKCALTLRPKVILQNNAVRKNDF